MNSKYVFSTTNKHETQLIDITKYNFYITIMYSSSVLNFNYACNFSSWNWRKNVFASIEK